MLCCLKLGRLGGGADGGGQEHAQMAVKREKKRIHDEIEKDLKADKKRRQREHRILLLGCGEAGKSTFIKQMRIIHSEGFSTEEKMEIKSSIASNILSAIQTLLQNTTPGSLSDELEEDVKIVEALSDRAKPDEIHPKHTGRISRLWKTDAVQAVYGQRNRFQLVQCAKYFLDRCESVLEPDYVPTNQDIVQTRVRTTGIIEHDFEITAPGEGKRKLILIDVGGQRSERKKWIHCFSDVLLLLFLTAVSEYDQVLAEDETTNRMQESLGLFKLILNYQWFQSTNVILFLNKKDVLAEKLPHSPVSDYFPDYEGGPNDYDDTIEFFSKKFTDLNTSDERFVYSHATCATDTENIKVVDTAVQEVILRNILQGVMLD